VAVETKNYQKIPQIRTFKDEIGLDSMKLEIDVNYKKVKRDVISIIEIELNRINNDPDLQYLVK